MSPLRGLFWEDAWGGAGRCVGEVCGVGSTTAAAAGLRGAVTCGRATAVALPARRLQPASDSCPVHAPLRSCCRRPPEFDSSSCSASQAADQLAALGLAESDEEGEGSSAAARQQQQGGDASAGQQPQAAGHAGSPAAGEAAGASGSEQGGGYYSSSDDDLPPIPKFNNRKVIEYEVSDSDSDDE